MRVRVGADKWVKHNVCHRQIVGLWPLIGAALHDHMHRSILADQTAQISCQVHACVSVQSLTYQLLPPRANRIPSAKVYAENEAGRVEPGQDSKRQRQEDHPHWPQEHLQQQTSTRLRATSTNTCSQHMLAKQPMLHSRRVQNRCQGGWAAKSTAQPRTSVRSKNGSALYPRKLR